MEQHPFQVRFRTFSFPKSAPRARSKQLAGERFECCRGGGQTFNSGPSDLNYLRAFFLEQAAGDLSVIDDVIRGNRDAGGWLIFATHDVAPNPSRFGVTPEFFEAVVRLAVESQSTILPVTEALAALRAEAGA